MIRKFRKIEKNKTTTVEFDYSKMIERKTVKANYPGGNKKDTFKIRTKRDLEDKIRDLMRDGFKEF